MSADGYVAVLVIDLHFADASSLKSKRQELSSIKSALHKRMGAAVAEIDHQDLWQRSAVAAVTVSSDHVHAEKVLRSVEAEAASLLGGELVDATVEWLA